MFADFPTWLLILVVILLVIGIPVGIIRVWATIQGGRFFSRQSEKSPLDIARERYAKGEISKSELDEIRKNLSN